MPQDDVVTLERFKAGEDGPLLESIFTHIKSDPVAFKKADSETYAILKEAAVNRKPELPVKSPWQVLLHTALEAEDLTTPKKKQLLRIHWPVWAHSKGWAI